MNVVLFVIFALLNVADAITTHKALTGAKGASEGNPIIAYLIDKLGLKKALIFKVLAAILAGVVIYICTGGTSWYNIVVQVLPILFYIYIVVNNLKIIKKLNG